MQKQPLTDEEVRAWLTRHTIMANIRRLQLCQYGHSHCSINFGGPCARELLERLYRFARNRALAMARSGEPRAEIAATIRHDYSPLGDDRLEMIIDEAFTLVKPD